MQLVHYEAACREIALANTIDEAKDWGDKAEALRAYARQAHNTDMEVQVAEIKLRALRRMGELSKALEKVTTIGGGEVGIPSGGKPKSEQLADAGVSTSAANRAEQLADVPEDEFEQSLAEHRDAETPATQASVKPKRAPRVKQAKNINQLISGLEAIAKITSTADVMVLQMTDKQRTRVENSITRAILFSNQIEEALGASS